MFNRVDARGFTEASVVPQGTNIIDGVGARPELPGRRQAGRADRRTAVPPGAAEAPNTASAVDPGPPPPPRPRPATGSPPVGERLAAPFTATATPKRPSQGLRARHRASASARGCAAIRPAAPAVWPAAPPARRGAREGQPDAHPVGEPRRRPRRPPRPRRRPRRSRRVAGPDGQVGERHLHLADRPAGDPTMVSPHVKELFDKVNCASKNWQQEIGYNPQIWNDPNDPDRVLRVCPTGPVACRTSSRSTRPRCWAARSTRPAPHAAGTSLAGEPDLQQRGRRRRSAP